MQQQTRSIVLEWLPPQRSDVTRYRVRLIGLLLLTSLCGMIAVRVDCWTVSFAVM